MWPDRRLLDLLKIEHPIVLAPMAGAIDFELAVAVAEAGGLGSLPFAMLNAEQAREQIAKYRARTQQAGQPEFLLPQAAASSTTRARRAGASG